MLPRRVRVDGFGGSHEELARTSLTLRMVMTAALLYSKVMTIQNA
jgi:hypothetical protein